MTALPKISARLRAGFLLYCRRHVRRHFHAVRVALDGLPGELGNGSAVVYLNHASWWDPLIAMLLAEEFFPGRQSFAPMEAAALAKYRIFGKLGLFPVETGTARGAREFLRVSSAVLAEPRQMLWVTPQARFADVRERPFRFGRGVARLWSRFPETTFLPLAIEYTHWTERLPEVLVRFGPPERGASMEFSGASLARTNHHLEHTLRRTMDALAADAMSRDGARFRTLVKGGAGASGIYDLGRRVKAFWGGEKFQAEHQLN